MAVVGNIQNHSLISKKILMLMFDRLMYLTYSALKAKQLEKLRLDANMS